MGHSSGDTSPGLAVIGVVTHNRVASLAPCVESYLSNCRKWRRSVDLIVMDDGDAGADTRAALRRVRTDQGQRIRYAGAAEKTHFAGILSRETSVPREIVDFALFGDPLARPCIGANRNALLLDTVGSLVFCADDDTSAQAGVLAAREEGIAFTGEYEPRDFWFFPNRRAALDAVSPLDIDRLGAHESLLGRAIAEPDGRTGRVVITLPGIVGDSGMGSPRFFLTLTGASRDRLLASREAYESALRSREILRTAARTTIANTPFCMTTFLGLDRRLRSNAQRVSAPVED